MSTETTHRQGTDEDTRQMRPLAVQTQCDFDVIRTAVNRWRTDNAPFLTRDEVVLLMLGQWLSSEGYLHTDAGDGLTANRAASAISHASLAGR